MKVLCVYESNYGLIFLASSIHSAIDQLIKQYWISAHTVVDWSGITLEEKFGNDWVNKIYAMTDDELNEFFMDSFNFEWETVYTE